VFRLAASLPSYGPASDIMWRSRKFVRRHPFGYTEAWSSRATAMVRIRGSSTVKPEFYFPRWSEYHTFTEWLAVLRDFQCSQPEESRWLSPAQTAVLRDLERAGVEWLGNARHLLDFRLWDLPRLRARNPEIARPRIDVVVALTTKGNLTVTWRPTEYTEKGARPTHDFAAWQRHYALNDYQAVAARPNNELLFIHDVEMLRSYPDQRPFVSTKHRILLYATRSLVQQIEQQLGDFFEVTVPVVFDFALDDDGHVTSWELIAADELWVRDFEKNNFGIKIADFCAMVREHSGNDTVIAKKLREAGFNKVTAREVRPWIVQYRTFCNFDNFHRCYAHLITGETASVHAFPGRPRL
jgi:hypothetical protein